MWVAGNAEDKHEQEKHNNSYACKPGIDSDGPISNEGNTNHDSKASTWEPWEKWVEMQQQFDSLLAAIKGAQKAPQKHPWQTSNQG